jgi:FkbM family methyltransferase
MLDTKRKMALARMALRVLLLLGTKPKQVVSRGGIKFELDLNEGIDLALFLFGSFQGHILRIAQRYLSEDAIVFDVGANCGAISLPMARVITRGCIYAFEPTEYAFAKLLRNLSCNPSIAERIVPVQTFLADSNTKQADLVAYSSWLMRGSDAHVERHPVHMGIHMSATSDHTTLDDFAARRNIPRVSLIKIDTDGFEYAILTGARKVISSFRPIIVFEACEYLMIPPKPCFEEFESFFGEYSYQICEPDDNQKVTADIFRKKCPPNGGYNLAAIPRERLHEWGKR